MTRLLSTAKRGRASRLVTGASAFSPDLNRRTSPRAAARRSLSTAAVTTAAFRAAPPRPRDRGRAGAWQRAGAGGSRLDTRTGQTARAATPSTSKRPHGRSAPQPDARQRRDRCPPNRDLGPSPRARAAPRARLATRPARQVRVRAARAGARARLATRPAQQVRSEPTAPCPPSTGRDVRPIEIWGVAGAARRTCPARNAVRRGGSGRADRAMPLPHLESANIAVTAESRSPIAGPALPGASGSSGSALQSP